MQRAGMMDYLDALELQRSLHREIADGVRENTLILLELANVRKCMNALPMVQW